MIQSLQRETANALHKCQYVAKSTLKGKETRIAKTILLKEILYRKDIGFTLTNFCRVFKFCFLFVVIFITVTIFKCTVKDAVKVLHSICWQIWETQQWLQDWKRSVFIPIPKKGNHKECSYYHTIALISHSSKVMLKILQARLQQHVNHELPDIQAGIRKGRRTGDQIANIRWIIEKAKEFQKNIYFCFIDYTKAFDCVDHSKLWRTLEMGIPDHLTCLLRNPCAGQEAIVRTGHGTTDWFQIRKRIC